MTGFRPALDGVHAVIVHRDSPRDLDACLAAIAGCCGVTVVDCDSRDGADAVALAHGAGLLRLHANPGYGAAANAGARRAPAETTVLVVANADVGIGPDGLAALARAIRSGAAAAGPVLPGRSPRRAVSLESALAELSEHPAAAGPDPAGPGDPVDVLSGALLALDIAAFRAIGGFDEGFVFYVEDDDLCRRMRAVGGRLVAVDGVRVEHVEGGASAALGHHRRRALLAAGRAKELGRHVGPSAAITYRRTALVRALVTANPLLALAALRPSAVRLP